MSNLKKYEMVETSVLHLRDAGDNLMYADGPDGEPDFTKPMRAHIYGPGSKQYAKAQAANQNRMIDKIKRKGKADQTAEQKIKEQADFLADCTQSLENIEGESGATGQELFLEIYTNLKLSFIPAQIATFINETGNFTSGSTTV